MADNDRQGWMARFGPVVLSFLLGSGAAGVSSYVNLNSRVLVLEIRHTDIVVELDKATKALIALELEVREVRRVADRLEARKDKP